MFLMDGKHNGRQRERERERERNVGKKRRENAEVTIGYTRSEYVFPELRECSLVLVRPSIFRYTSATALNNNRSLSIEKLTAREHEEEFVVAQC